MRPLYLNPQDELRVCLSMESLQETCMGMEEETARAVKRRQRQKTVDEPSGRKASLRKFKDGD